MNLTQLLRSTAELIREREIIQHEEYRCPLEPNLEVFARSYQLPESEVKRGRIGSDDLAKTIKAIADKPELIMDAQAEGVIEKLHTLWRVYNGDDLDNYVDAEDDAFTDLDTLIDAANSFASAVTGVILAVR